MPQLPARQRGPTRAHPPSTSNRRCRRRRRRTSRLITGGYLRLRSGRGFGARRRSASLGRSFYLEPQAPPEPAQCTSATPRHARADLCPASPRLFILLSLKPLAEQVRKQQPAHTPTRSRPAGVTTAHVRTEAAVHVLIHRPIEARFICSDGSPHDMSEADQAFALSGGTP